MTIREEVEEMKKEVEEIKDINYLANEVASEANKALSISKRKITCLTVLIGLLFVLGASVAMYSIYSLKELFYNMECEVTTIDAEQNTDGNGCNFIITNSDNNTVGK